MERRDKIDNILISVKAKKTTEREWEFLNGFNSPMFNAINIARALLESRSAFDDVSESLDLISNLKLVSG